MPPTWSRSDTIAAFALVVALASLLASLAVSFFGFYQDTRSRDEQRIRVYRGSFAIGTMWGDVHRHVTWQIGAQDHDRDATTARWLRDLLPLVKAMDLDIDPSVYKYSDVFPDKPAETNVGTLLYNALQFKYNDGLAVTAFLLGDDLAEMCDIGSLHDIFTSQIYDSHRYAINVEIGDIKSGCPPLPERGSDPAQVQLGVSRLYRCLEREWTITAKRPWYDFLSKTAPTPSPPPAAAALRKDYDWCQYHHTAFYGGFSGG